MKTILLVDDEPCILETARYILEARGYRILTACDGQLAMDVLRREKPLVVLLDVMMPGRNGFEVCREIRSDPDLEKTYVIFLTARGRKEDEERALEAGGDSYLMKPFNDEEVMERIDACFAAPDASHPGCRSLPALREHGASSLRHDLMGMLFALNGTARVLQESGSLDDWQSQCVETIVEAGKRIESLVTEHIKS